MTSVSERALKLAVERDVLTLGQVERLQAIEAELSPETADVPSFRLGVDDEQLRLVSGFADIFVTIGIVLFVGALAFFMDAGSGSTPALAGMGAAAWLLAEFFTGKHRMALPSIVLLLLFVVAVFLVSLQVFTALLPTSPTVQERFWFLPTPDPAALAVAAMVTAGLAALHFVRFRVPITVAAGAAALCLLALGTVASLAPALNETGINVVLLICGLAVFALAMGFDISDPARRSRRTDIAFWLHLLAAPLIVHPLLRGMLHTSADRLSVGAAVGILWVFVLLGVLAVVIDRRAILVSGLLYAGVAFGTLIRSVGLTGETYLFPAVLLALGAFILLLSAGWQPLRRALLRRLPLPVVRRLPHPLLVSTT